MNARFSCLVVGLFAVAGLALAVVLAFALDVLGGQTKTVCADPPLLQAQLPQWVILVALTVGFVVGGLTSTWAVRNVHRADHARARAMIDDRLGRRVMHLTFIGVFVLLTGLLVLEAVDLSLHVWPITYYVRCANEASTLLSALGAGIYAFLAGRWLWVRR